MITKLSIYQFTYVPPYLRTYLCIYLHTNVPVLCTYVPILSTYHLRSYVPKSMLIYAEVQA